MIGRGLLALRRRALTAAVLVGGAAAAVCAAPASAQAATCANAGAPPEHLSRPTADRALRCLINQVRHQQGLRAVRAERHLARAARRHASDMASHDYFAHVSPRGSTVKGRVAHTGYLRRARGWALGEALAWGRNASGTPSAILQALLNSPPHRAILLNGRFRDLGVGVARGAPQGAGGGAVTIVLDFGRLHR